MLFDKTHIGKPISELLAKYLKEWTTQQDRINVCRKTGVGLSTIRDVVYKGNSLTDNNSVAIIELMKIAVANCNDRIQFAKKAKTYIEKVIEV